jgi:replicative DNA helicase
MIPQAAFPTGISEIDLPRGGMPIGSLTVFGGRPESGKFTLLWEVATRLAADGQRVAVCSMGSDNHDGPTRLMHACDTAGIDEAIVSANVKLLAPTVPTVRELSKLVDDDLDALVIESLSLIEPPPGRWSVGVDLAEFAAHRQMAVIAGSELCRKADGRRPLPSDVRDSSSFAIDLLILLHRLSDDASHDLVEVELIVDAGSEHPHEGMILLSGVGGRFLL